MRCVLEEHHAGLTIGGRRETDLRFADDTTLLCTSKEELLALLKKVKEAGMSQNLLLNTQNTTIMVVDKGRERREDFVLDGEKIGEVDSFVYLGSLYLSTSKAVVHRKSGGGWRWGALQNMVSILKSRDMTQSQVFRATDFPIAMYGCESLAMTSCDNESVDAFERWCYRRLLLGCHGWRGKRTTGCWRRLG